MTGPRVESRVLAMQLCLRVWGEAARQRLAEALHIAALPATNRWVASTHGDVLWMSPDEWLLVQSGSDLLDLPTWLANAIGPAAGGVVDVSAARVGLVVAGDDARDVLASCCSLDLHERAFPEGACARTLLGQAPVVIQRLAGASSFLLLVPPSYEDYATRWLNAAS